MPRDLAEPERIEVEHLHFPTSDAGAAWEAIYRATRAAVRRGRRSDDAEDLVQNALERVVRSLREGSFAGRCSLSTWATTIARRVVVDDLRGTARRERCVPEAASEEVGAVHDPEPHLEARSMLAVIEDALAELGALDAQVLVLHDALGHDLTDVAALVGASPSATQSRLIRARRRVQGIVRRRLGAAASLRT